MTYCTTLPPALYFIELALTQAYLKDTPHCSSDYHWQYVCGVRQCEILEPQKATSLQAGHRKVGHFSQGNEEGNEDWGLLYKMNSVRSLQQRVLSSITPWFQKGMDKDYHLCARGLGHGKQEVM